MSTRTTELDDAIEQVLARFIPDTLWRIQARNEVVALIAAAGFDVYAQVPAPYVDALTQRVIDAGGEQS